MEFRSSFSSRPSLINFINFVPEYGHLIGYYPYKVNSYPRRESKLPLFKSMADILTNSYLLPLPIIK